MGSGHPLKFLALFAFFSSAVLPAAFAEEGRGFTMNAGVGWEALTGYPRDISKALTTVRGLRGVSETDINLNLDLGWYLGPLESTGWGGEPSVTEYWLVVGVNSYAVRFEDTSGWFQINNYVYGIGVQYLLGNFYGKVEVGPAVAVVQVSTSDVFLMGRSPTGFGVAWQMGWDFNPKGLGLLLGINGALSFIDGGAYSGLGLVVGLTYL